MSDEAKFPEGTPEWVKELHQEPDEDEYYPGLDPDGRERLDPFAGRFASKSTAMQGVTHPEEPEPGRGEHPGAVRRSPFV